MNSGLLQARSDGCWADGGVSQRMLGDAAVVGQVRGCPGLFLAVLANPGLMMLQIRSDLCRQGPAWLCTAPGARL